MEKFRVNNSQLIEAFAGVIYRMHPYHKPENFDKIMDALLKRLDTKAKTHNGKKLTFIMLEVKFKKLVETAKCPIKAHPTDAGADLTAVSREWDEEYGCWIYGTGIATEIPEGYVGLIFPRSSIRKYNLAQCN